MCFLFSIIFVFLSQDGLTSLAKDLVASFCEQYEIQDDHSCVALSFHDRDSMSVLSIKYIPEPIGKRMRIKGGKIRVWCEQGLNPFYVQTKQPLSLPFYDDTYEWVISLDSLGRLNPILSYSNQPGDALNRIVNIFSTAGKAPSNQNWMKDRVFAPWEVSRTAGYSDGEENIRALIHNWFTGMDDIRGIPRQIPIVAILLVDENGVATFDSLVTYTGIEALDNLAIDLCHLLCTHQFTPAIFQERPVKSTFTVLFMKKDML